MKRFEVRQMAGRIVGGLAWNAQKFLGGSGPCMQHVIVTILLFVTMVVGM